MEVQNMGLSAREQQALHSIEGGLNESDPDLASKLASLTRLMAGEDKPPAERSRVGWLHRLVSSLVRWLPGPRGRGHSRPHPGRGPAILVIWLAISFALIATAATLSHVATSGACASLVSVSCGSRSPAGPAHPGAR
jgi:hypothetical protein